MKRYIRAAALLQAVIIVGAFALACSLVFSKLQAQTIQTQLRTVIEAAALVGEAASYEELAGHLTKEDDSLRVTVAEKSGEVVYDTQGLVKDSHSDRKEIAEALAGGWGYDVRKSQTTGAKTLYVAGLLPDGLVLRLGYPLSQVNRFVNAVLFTALILLALALLFTYAFSNRFAARLMRPLNQINALLQDEGEAAGAGAEGAKPFPEVAPILDNISTKIDKLHYDIAEIRRTQQLRSDFVANASHELKSPLTAIKGFAELLESGMIEDEAKGREFLGRIVLESDRLLNIIEDILHLSQAERGAPEDVVEVDLRAMTQEIVSALEPQAARKRISLEVAGGGSFRANANEMWELLYNLIDNGIRYGREGGFVRVRIDKDGVTVLDNGIGIAPDQISRIFERFYRVDKSHTRSDAEGAGGTGLGLSIARHIAQKYGGELTVDSTPGEGSSFSARFARVP